jgi:hypothetical protein
MQRVGIIGCVGCFLTSTVVLICLQVATSYPRSPVTLPMLRPTGIGQILTVNLTDPKASRWTCPMQNPKTHSNTECIDGTVQVTSPAISCCVCVGRLADSDEPLCSQHCTWRHCWLTGCCVCHYDVLLLSVGVRAATTDDGAPATATAA